MGIVWGSLHKLSRRLNFGLRNRIRRAKSGEPVGPRLVRWRLRRGPYSERAHLGRVKFARLLLLVAGGVALATGAILCLYAVDEAVAFYAATGVLFVILNRISGKRPVPSLWIGLVLFAVAIWRTTVGLAEFASDPYESVELLGSILFLGYAILLGVLVSLLAGARSAMILVNAGSPDR